MGVSNKSGTAAAYKPVVSSDLEAGEMTGFLFVQ